MYVEHVAQTLINGKCLTKFDYLLSFLLLFSFCLTWQVTGQTKIQLRINLEGPIFGKIFYDLSRALEIILSIILLSTECFLHPKSRRIAVGAIVLNIEWFNLEIFKKVKLLGPIHLFATPCAPSLQGSSWNKVELILQMTTRGKKRVRQYLRRNIRLE